MLSSYVPSAAELAPPPAYEDDSVPAWVTRWSHPAAQGTARLIWKMTGGRSTRVSDLDDDGVRTLVNFIAAFGLPGLDDKPDIECHVEARRGSFISEKVRRDQAVAWAVDVAKHDESTPKRTWTAP